MTHLSLQQYVKCPYIINLYQAAFISLMLMCKTLPPSNLRITTAIKPCTDSSRHEGKQFLSEAISGKGNPNSWPNASDRQPQTDGVLFCLSPFETIAGRLSGPLVVLNGMIDICLFRVHKLSISA